MTKNTGRQITKVIEGIVQLCLGKAGCVVWVDQADAAAFCDGSSIYLPKPTGEHEEEYPLILAMAMREVAKLKHTSASAFAATSQEDVQFSALLEDVRIKRLMGMDYLGTPHAFRRGFEISNAIFERRAEAGELPEGLATQLAIWHAANSALDPSMGGAPDAGVFGKMVGLECEPDRLAEAVQMAAAGPMLGSTAEAVTLGRAIFEVLRKPDEAQTEDKGAPEPGSQSQQDGAGDDAADGEESAQEGGDVEEQGGEQDQTETVGVDAAAGDESSPGGGDADTQCPGQDHPDVDVGDAGSQGAVQDQADEAGSDQQGADGDAQGADLLSDALAALRGFCKAVRSTPQERTERDGHTLTDQELEQIAHALASPEDQLAQLNQPGAEAGDVGMEEAASNEPDHAEDTLVDLDAMIMGHGDGAGCGLATETGDDDRTLTGVPGRLVGVLQRELHEQRRRPTRLASAGHRIDASRLWRLKRLGETNVFRRRAYAPGIDAAVEILLDRSGSMDAQMGEAANVTYALALALQRITGVQTAVDVFPGADGSVESVLAFKESAHRANQRLSTIKASGGTPTGAALATVLPRLLQAKCLKRLLFVITDGMPNAGQFILTKEKIAEAASQGVTVVGIGIGAEAKVEALFQHNIKVEMIADLPQELEQLFKSSLLDWIEA